MKEKIGKYISEFSFRNKTKDNYNVYSVTNSRGFILSTDYFSKEVFSKDLSTYKLVERNMLAYNPSRINVGSISCQNEEDIIIVSPLYVVFKVDTEILRPKYIESFLKSNIGLDQIRSLTSGSVRNSLKYSALERIELKIPTLSKQDKVLRNLTKITALIKKRKEQLLKLDELAKSQFIEMFGEIESGNFKFKIEKLENVAFVGSSHRVFTSEFVPFGIPFYRGTEIGSLSNGIQPIEPYYITEDHYNRLANDKTKPQKGDLLMPSICDKGQIWLVDTDKPFYYKDGRVLSISADRAILNTSYLHHYLKRKTQIDYKKIGSGSTFAEFKIFLLKNMAIMLPPMQLQNQFANLIQQLDKSKFRIEKSLKHLEIARTYENI